MFIIINNINFTLSLRHHFIPKQRKSKLKQANLKNILAEIMDALTQIPSNERRD